MDLKTLTGMDLFEAFRELDRQLPKNAYKAIEGGKGQTLGLTDIIPAFLPDLLMELFGPLGFGWCFEIDRMETDSKTVERKGGYTEETFTATCQISIWYVFLQDRELKTSAKIHATGASTNASIEWAMKGALTNALGCAWFFCGYQLSVYKGERSHNGGPPADPPKRQQRQAAKDQPKARQEFKAAPEEEEWKQTIAQIGALVTELQLDPSQYWKSVREKYGCGRDNLSVSQVREQFELLLQCKQYPDKLAAFKELLVPKAA